MSGGQYPHLALRVTEKLANRLNKVLKGENKSGSNDNSSSGGTISNELLIKVEPEASKDSDYYSFEIEDDEYPALLGNCPCLIEAYKTYDTKVILKSGDVGQMLYVFETEAEREKMKELIRQTDTATYLPHGLTIPTQNIVERKFKKTKRHKRQSIVKIADIIDHIETTWGYAETKTGTVALENNKEMVIVFEEAVVFEDWMMDPMTGKCITIEVSDDYTTSTSTMNILLQHPNLLISQLDLEEEKETEEEEQMRRALALDSKRTEAEALQSIVSQTVVSETIQDTNALSLKLKDKDKDKEKFDQLNRNENESRARNRYTTNTNTNASSLPSDDDDDDDDDFDLDEALQMKVNSTNDIQANDNRSQSHIHSHSHINDDIRAYPRSIPSEETKDVEQPTEVDKNTQLDENNDEGGIDHEDVENEDQDSGSSGSNSSEQNDDEDDDDGDDWMNAEL